MHSLWMEKLKQVKQRFPWYEQYLPANPPRHFKDLPLLTSEILEKHYYIDGEYESTQCYQTSGTSSGKRKKIWYSAQDDAWYLKVKTEIYRQFLLPQGGEKALADVGTGHAASTADHVFRALGVDCRSIAYHRPIQEHITLCEQYKPDYLYTMPSIVEHLALAMGDPRSLGLKKIILVGEIASLQWQKKLAERFGIQPEDILDTYGSIEIGTLASYSHALKRYVIADGLWAEGVSSADISLDIDPLQDGECILALTAWRRELFPALRYVTYDVVRDLQTVRIGDKTVQTFQHIVKRVGAELKHGEKISLYDIEEVVYRYLHDAKLQVHVSQNELSVHIFSPQMNERVRQHIAVEIQERIPEIGAMIRQGMLSSIQVRAVGINDLKATAVKQKKIYYVDQDRDQDQDTNR